MLGFVLGACEFGSYRVDAECPAYQSAGPELVVDDEGECRCSEVHVCLWRDPLGGNFDEAMFDDSQPGCYWDIEGERVVYLPGRLVDPFGPAGYEACGAEGSPPACQCCADALPACVEG